MPIGAPLVASVKLTKHEGEFLDDPTLYMTAVGVILYSILIMPELLFPIRKLC